jgi:hypothetical protein
VYQERLLSSRILHCLNNELAWECKQQSGCECRTVSTEHGIKQRHEAVLHLKSRESTANEWRAMVEVYSRLHITFQSDRLPALSGIAQQMQRLYHGEYYAGLWSDDLPGALCWHVARTGSPSWARKDHPRIGSKPTWSWASVEVPVSYSYDAFPWGPYVYSARATFVSCQCMPAGLDHRGEISSGKIVIAGAMLQGYIDMTGLTSDYLPYYIDVLAEQAAQMSDMADDFIGEALLDRNDLDHGILDSDDAWAVIPVWVMEIQKVRTGENFWVDCLLLQASKEETGTYTRLGMMQCSAANLSTERVVGLKIVKEITII